MSRWRIAAVAAASLLITVPASAQETASITAVGWWSRSPGQQAPVGGFAVANAPDGPVTVAALLIDTGRAGVASATLTAVETGGVASAVAAVRLCAADDGWTPEPGGAMAEAPASDCDAATTAFERDADAATWSADLLPLLSGRTGVVSVAFVPAEGAGAAAAGLPPVAFEVRFAAPTLDARPNATSSEGAGGAGPTPSADDAAAGATPESAAQPAAPVRAEVGPSLFVTPDPAPVEPPVAPANQPAETAAPPAPEAGEPQEVASVFADGDGNGRRWGQALVFLVVSAAAGCGAGFGRRYLRTRAA